MKRHLAQLLLMLVGALSVSLSGARAATPVTPNASPGARALLNFIHDMYGEKTLSGQMWAPWGIDEIETVERITGKLPAIRGQDYIHERANNRENQLAMQWWKAGGIPTIMWHWGAPSKGEGYNQSKMAIDIDRCFEPGTAEHTAMWKDLRRIADHLTELRDAKVPVLWRPMHECDGNWFWWMLWHTSHLTRHDRDALTRAYNHELVLTRDELPSIMDYLDAANEQRSANGIVAPRE